MAKQSKVRVSAKAARKPAPRAARAPRDLPRLTAGTHPSARLDPDPLLDRLRAWHAEPARYCAVPSRALQAEVRALAGGRADLPRFAAEEMPVDAARFDALDALAAALGRCDLEAGICAVLLRRERKGFARARAEVRRRLTVAAARAQLGGMPRALARLGRAAGSPLWQVEAARRQAAHLAAWLAAPGRDPTPDPQAPLARALALAADHADAIDHLQRLQLGLRSDTAGLKSLLHDDLQLLARWGRALQANDGGTHGHYNLPRLKRPKRAVVSQGASAADTELTPARRLRSPRRHH